MTHRRILMGFAAALLMLPMHSGARADTGAKIVEEVDFSTSCSPAVSMSSSTRCGRCTRSGIPEALKDFTAITEAEPDCAIGYWGIAMSHWYPLWFPPSRRR